MALHNQGLKNKEIAQRLGCKASQVTQRLNKLGIKARKCVDDQRIMQLHNEGYYDYEIAEQLGCARTTVSVHIKKNLGFDRHGKADDVALRNRISQSLVGRYVGCNNPNYSGEGTAKLRARGLCKTFSKRLIRNSPKCDHCNSEDELELHHIKPFATIFDEFMTTCYNGDESSLYDQLMSFDPFVDESNMVILCHKCHSAVHYSDNPELSPYRWESATTIENTCNSASE